MHKIVIYSHGFGVQKDDRGLFTDIASGLPNTEHVLFDYNQVDETNNTLTVTPLDTQAEMLTQEVSHAKTNNPDAALYLLCHAQGCVTAALAQPAGIAKTIFLAPPAHFPGAAQQLQQMNDRPGTTTDKNGVTRYPRRDGSTTIIKPDYWESRNGIEPIDLYNQLAKITDLTIITAVQDEVLGDTDFSGLAANVQTICLDANHDFTGDVRWELVGVIKEILSADGSKYRFRLPS